LQMPQNRAFGTTDTRSTAVPQHFLAARAVKRGIANPPRGGEENPPTTRIQAEIGCFACAARHRRQRRESRQEAEKANRRPPNRGARGKPPARRIGSSGGIRTPDQGIMIPLLYH